MPPLSRSPSLKQDDRRRSRSPRRHYSGDNETEKPKKRTGGFRWKEKRPPTDDEPSDSRRGLERGYREKNNERSPERGRTRDVYRDDYDPGNKRKEDRAIRTGADEVDRENRDRAKREKRERKEKKAAAAPKAPTEPMIIVTVNDRLGTKASIPCLASDPIRNYYPLSGFVFGSMIYAETNIVYGTGLFKAQVAARIGREPHEILLKRQGERPFKDQLTLEDYGVSNGVQLDL